MMRLVKDIVKDGIMSLLKEFKGNYIKLLIIDYIQSF